MEVLRGFMRLAHSPSGTTKLRWVDKSSLTVIAALSPVGASHDAAVAEPPLERAATGKGARRFFQWRFAWSECWAPLMPRKERVGTCVYCGITGPVTSDHVPPKCLFPPDARLNLMTVAACPACHGSFKLDDEYFRLVLSIRPDLPSGSESSFIQEQTKRSLRNPEAAGLLASIRASTSRREVRTRSGIYLGKAHALRWMPLASFEQPNAS